MIAIGPSWCCHRSVLGMIFLLIVSGPAFQSYVAPVEGTSALSGTTGLASSTPVSAFTKIPLLALRGGTLPESVSFEQSSAGATQSEAYASSHETIPPLGSTPTITDESVSPTTDSETTVENTLNGDDEKMDIRRPSSLSSRSSSTATEAIASKGLDQHTHNHTTLQQPFRTRCRVPNRRASDVIVNLEQKSRDDRQHRQQQEGTNRINSINHGSTSPLIGTDHEQVEGSAEAHAFRHLISQRATEYITEWMKATSETSSDTTATTSSRRLVPEPKKLMYSLASKIPAIKYSPDVALRIQTANTDMDCGLAACLIGTLAHACEIYDQMDHSVTTTTTTTTRDRSIHDPEKKDVHRSVGLDLINDRRFEQLVECMLCGVEEVNMAKGRSPAGMRFNATNIHKTAHIYVPPGLSIRDCCRAAWGLTMLGIDLNTTIGQYTMSDILIGISTRIQSLLLLRLQQLQRDEILIEYCNATLEERLDRFSEALAGDTAAVLWTFACVRACTGTDVSDIFDLCGILLCQNPIQLRCMAQEEDAYLHDVSLIGSNDVVERLARSEAEVVDNVGNYARIPSTSDDPTQYMTHQEIGDTGDDNTSLLLDWLSAPEVIDLLWAVAVHGKHNTAIDGFCEAAFARISSWLRNVHETVMQGQALTANVEDSSKKKDAMIDASHSDQPWEEPTGFKDYWSKQVAYIHNLAPICRFEGGFSVPLTVVGELITDYDSSPFSSHAVRESMFAEEKGVTVKGVTEKGDNGPPLSTGIERKERFIMNSLLGVEFCAADLCSLVWAVTELHSPFRFSITNIVSNIFATLGRDSLQDLSGGNLCNLAWAVSKNRIAEDCSASSCYELVTRWLAYHALSYVSVGGITLDSERLLQCFRPPELSRLLSSIACVVEYSPDAPDPSMERLATLSLLASTENSSIHEIEDLANIAWAFLALTRNSARVLSQPRIAECLGKIFVMIESSLIHWERGRYQGTKSPNQNALEQKEPTRFASFLGRSRRYFPLLDQYLDECFDEGDSPLSSSHAQKARLPLLRDLHIDPLTLCKVASCFSKLASETSVFRTRDTLVSISMRLLVSRNARLLKELPLCDILPLLEAVALADSLCGRELTGLFTRKVLNYIHHLPRDALGAFVHCLRPSEFAVFLWSLGKLGVKYCPSEYKSSSHRRLQLVAKPQFLNPSKVVGLPLKSLVRLLHGIVTTNIALCDVFALTELLSFIQTSISMLSDSADVCLLLESLSSLRAVVETDENLASTYSATWNETHIFDAQSYELVQSERLEVLKMCDRLLSVISERALLLIPNCTTAVMRTILSLYANVPFHCDELADRIYREISSRELLLGQEIMGLGDPSSALLDSAESPIVGKLRDDRNEHVGSLTPMEKRFLMESVGVPYSSECLDAAIRFDLSQCREQVEQYRRLDFTAGNRQSRLDQQRRNYIAKRIWSRLLP